MGYRNKVLGFTGHRALRQDQKHAHQSKLRLVLLEH